MQKHYKARPDRIVKVAGVKVTDDPRGVPLPDTTAVQEHERLGRLIEVKKPARPATDSKEKA